MRKSQLWVVSAAMFVGSMVVIGVFADTPAGAAAERVTASAQTSAAVRPDPAAARLRLITFGLMGLGGVVAIGTIIFWRSTRPPLKSQGAAAGDTTAARVPTAAEVAAVTVTQVSRSGSSPLPKIPASVVLATPPAALPAMASVLSVDPTSEPEVGVPASPVSTSPVSASPVASEPPAPAPELAPDTRALMAALAAIPDVTPTAVRFDDPPVQRVVRSMPKPPPRSAPLVTEPVDIVAPTPRVVDEMAVMASALNSLPARPESADAGAGVEEHVESATGASTPPASTPDGRPPTMFDHTAHDEI